MTWRVLLHLMTDRVNKNGNNGIRISGHYKLGAGITWFIAYLGIRSSLEKFEQFKTVTGQKYDHIWYFACTNKVKWTVS